MSMPAWSLLHAQIHQVLKTRYLLQKGESVLVAVSGGQDSVCLAKLLLDLQPKWHWNLAIAHCDHQWREDSAANANHVRQLAKHWNLPYFQRTTDHRLNSEASARQWRYTSLADIAQQHNYQTIATGHTASDRAETLIYNLVRGSGADGLQAITWKRPLAENALMLVRPLLEVTRTQTHEFCQTFNLPIWEDSTNQDLKYARNRIRHQVLPDLQHLNPNVETALAQTAELLQAEVDFLEQAAETLRNQAMSDSQSYLQFNRRVLQQAPLAIQRRVIRQILLNALPNAPTFAQIEKLVALLNAPNRSQTDPFPGKMIAQVNGDWIQFKKLS